MDNGIETLFMKQITDSIKYIKLGSGDDIILTSIQKIKTDSSLLIILDAEPKLVVFDIDGNYITQIGQKGSGPNEYLHVHDFSMDNDRKEIVIFDYMRGKALRHSYNGTFIESIDLEEKAFQTNQVEFIENNMLCNYVLPNQYWDIEYEYKTYRTDEQSFVPTKNILPFQKGINSGNSIGRPYLKPISKSPDHLLFSSCFSNILYEYNGKEIKQKYYIDTDLKIADEDFFFNHRDIEYRDLIKVFEEKKIFSGVSNLNENSRYVVMGIEGKCLIWDKVLKQNVNFYFLENEDIDVSFFLSNEIVNIYKEGFILMNGAEYLHDNKEFIANRTKNQDLLKILEDIKFEDNPVLTIFYLKDNFIKDIK